MQTARKRVRCSCGPDVGRFVVALYDAADSLASTGEALVRATQQSRGFVARTIGSSGRAPDPAVAFGAAEMADEGGASAGTVTLDASVPLDPQHLAPNTTYRLNEISWTTDGNGHVSHVDAELRLVKSERHEAHQTATGRRGEGYDDGGHLIGTQFGGFGSGPNIVPQARTLNQSRNANGQWFWMEKTWANNLREGRRVHVSIDLVGDAERPEFLVVRYTINDTPYEISFLNENFAGDL